MADQDIRDLSELPTPALVIELSRVTANAERMRQKAKRSGVTFRPHVKTHKTVEGARLQHGGGSGPITVSTLAEAEFFADAGFEDLTYAVPIAPDKLSRVAALMRRARRFNILLDNESTLRAIEAFSRQHRVVFDVFLKVDCGAGRAGVKPEDPQAMALAMRLHRSSDVRFWGFLTHAGHSYRSKSRAEILTIAEEEARTLGAFASELARSGVAGARAGLGTGVTPTDAGTRLSLSTGATPTASVLESFRGCDEVRPGNYIFYDAQQLALGSCSLEDCAASILVTVIGAFPKENKLLVDGGALAFSKDHDAGAQPPDFGVVCDVNLRRLPIRLTSLSQEHGKAYADAPIDYEKFTIGSKLRIIPNHSCLAAAMHSTYYVVDSGQLRAEWHPVRGW